MKKIFALLTILNILIFVNTSAQLKVDTTTAKTMTSAQFAKYLVDNFFAGEGVDISNIKFTGKYTVAMSSFSNGNTTNIGIDKGVILSTGRVQDAIGPNNIGGKGTTNATAGYALLTSMTGVATNDAAVLEFDFIPSCDSIKFKYVFGSEEYMEWVNSAYNDGFGFFITGPNPAGGNYSNYNIARIPGTSTVVTINNLNLYKNASYYVDNDKGTTIQYDGFTDPMYALAKVVPNQKYHIIIAIADAGDAMYDSGVLLEAGSFGSKIYRINVVSTVGNTNKAIEGCANAIVSFKLPNPTLADVVVKYTISGDAISGVDYVDFPDSVIIKAGTDSAGLLIVPIKDALVEGTEYINFEVPINYCGTNITFKAKVPITDYIDVNALPFNDTILLGDSSFVNINVTGGSTPYTYTWNTGLITDTAVYVSPTQTTTYNITITDACNNSIKTTAVIKVITPCDVEAGANKSICKGDQVTLTATSSSGGTYSWLNAGVGATVNVSPTITTTYKVRLIKNDCTSYDSLVVTVNPLPSANAGADKTILKGASTNLTATGGGTYLWSTAQTTATITVTPTITTTYKVTVTSNGCSATDAVVVTVQNFTLNAGADQTICIGQSATLIVTGADTYKWSTNATTPTITATPTLTTTYKVTGTKSGATATDDVVVYVNPLPTVNLGTDKSICKGETASLSITGTFFVTWSTNDTSKTISVKPNSTTTYKITATDTKGCSNTDDIIVIVNNVPTANAGADKTILKGASTNLTATGGGTYLWSTSQTASTITVNPTITTTYKVTVTSNGCSATDAVVVTVLNLTTNAGTNQTICIGQSVTLTATGADTYKWSTNATTATITVSPTLTTTYKVTGTKSGATATDDVVVYVNTLPTVNLGTDKSICKGDITSLSISGSFSVIWSTNDTSKTISIKPNATTTYKITATDTKGCSNTDDIIVTVNNVPTANAGADKTILKGASTNLTATGGGTYLWSTSQTASTITVNPTITTTYKVTVTSNGCSATDAVVVTVLNLTTNAGTDQTICIGQTATLTATGADTYKWSTNATTATITVSPTLTTTYKVTGTKSGATATDDVVVYVNPLPIVNIGTDKSICKGDVQVLNVDNSFSAKWNSGQITNTISVKPSITTSYSVTVTDNNGCTATDGINIIVNDIPNVNAGNDITIFKGSTTTLTAIGNGSFIWNTAQTTPSITVNPSVTNTYLVTLTKNNCTASDAVVVTVVDLNINAGTDKTICAGSSVILSVTGADTYQWTIDNGQQTLGNSVTVTPVVTTTYTVTGYKEGAYATDNVIVVVNQLPFPNLINDTTINYGDSITIKAENNGSVYIWNTGQNTASIIVNPSIETTYSITVIDLNNCIATDQVIVKVKSAFYISKIIASRVTCATSQDAYAQVFVIGGYPPLKYLWSNGGITEKITNISSGKYTVTVTDSLGFKVSREVTVMGPGFVPMPNVSTIRITNTTAMLKWELIPDATSYMVRYRKVGTNSWIYVNTNSTKSFVTVYYLTSGTEYEWQIRVIVDNSNYSCFTEPIKFKTMVSLICNAIKNPKTKSISTSRAIATWEYDTVVNYFFFRYRVKGTDTWKYIYANGNSYLTVLAGLTQNTTYEWQIRAFCLNGEYSDFSPIVEFTTIDKCLNPNNTYETSIISTSAVLNWSQGDGVIYNLVRWREKGTTDWRYANVSKNLISVGCSVCNENDMLKPTTVYEWQIRSFCNAEGTSYSEFSPIDTFITAKLRLAINGANSICEGTSTILTELQKGKYLWNTGDTNVSINVSPTQNTTYIVTITFAGITVTDSKIVYVNSKIDVNAGNDMTICNTDSAHIIVTGATNYEWSPGSMKDNITVMPLRTTTYIVTGISGNCSGTDDVIVFVNQKPYADAGADVFVCEGNSVDLIATGGNSYSWSNNVITEANRVSPTSTAYYTVTVSNGNCSASDQVVIVVEPFNYTISEDISICNGETVTLQANGATNYEWSTGQKANSVVVSPSQTTEYFVTIKNYAGCSKVESITVTIGNNLNVNVGNDTTICKGERLTLKAEAENSTSFRWSTGSLKQSITVAPVVTTNYMVTVKAGVCVGTNMIVVNIVQCKNTETEETLKENNVNVSIYPNPSLDGIINIVVENIDSPFNITIIDAIGKTIQTKYIKETLNTVSFNLQDVENGIYFIKIQNNNFSNTYKAIIRR